VVVFAVLRLDSSAISLLTDFLTDSHHHSWWTATTTTLCEVTFLVMITCTFCVDFATRRLY